jgi:hypothetical protein
MTLAEVRANDDAEKIERLEGAMLELPQVDCPVEHFFAPGLYIRQITIPAGALVVGHEHKTEHVNIMLKGRVTIATAEGVATLVAPVTFIAPPGRKVALAHEETVWQNVHATEERDLAKIEETFIRKSETWQAHNETAALVDRLREHALSGKGVT